MSKFRAKMDKFGAKMGKFGCEMSGSELSRGEMYVKRVEYSHTDLREEYVQLVAFSKQSSTFTK